MLPRVRPRFVVCEDGAEYRERFQRFLGGAFEFLAAADYASARDAAAGAHGLLLDLDFRRTPPHHLVAEGGPAPQPLSDGERRRLAGSQGILILRLLRAAGVALPALLFADFDDPEQARFLEQTLAPLTIVSSRAGLREVAAIMHAAVGESTDAV
jgi:hypothetical protein